MENFDQETLDVLKKVNDNVTAMNTNLTQANTTLKGEIDVAKGEIEKFRVEIKDIKEEHLTQIKALETTIQGKMSVSLDGVDTEKEKFSFFKAYKAISTKDWSEASYEQTVFKETAIAAKAQGMSPATAGGYLVPVQVSSQIIELLLDKLTLQKLGCTILTGLMGKLSLPKHTSGATAYWIPENSGPITESENAFEQLTLSPKTVCALTVLSMQVLSNTSPSIEGIIRSNFAQVLATAIVKAALTGRGAAGEPIGITNTTGINTTAIGTNGGAFDFIQANKMTGTLEDDNADAGNLKFVMHPKVKRKLVSERIAQYSGDLKGAYNVLPFSDSNLSALLGYDFNLTTQLATNLTKGSGTNLAQVIFGNWSELLVGFWGGLALYASDSAGNAFEYNQIKIKAIMECDTQVRHPESFCLCSDADTTGA